MPTIKPQRSFFINLTTSLDENLGINISHPPIAKAICMQIDKPKP